MNCTLFRQITLAQNDPTFEHVFSPSVLADQGEHTKTCLVCVRWLEEQMDAEDLSRGVTTAIPTLTAIPGEAAVAIEQEASDRLDKTNAHLRRTVAEVHKMMIWHQYAAAAVSGLMANKLSVGNPTQVASEACAVADVMMQQIRQRKLM